MSWDPGFDALLNVCEHEHRRIVLATFVEEPCIRSVQELGMRIIEQNHQIPAEEATDELHAQIAISLHHVHLPMIQSAGIIAYDAEEKLVEPSPRFDQLVPVVSKILEAEFESDAPKECVTD